MANDDYLKLEGGEKLVEFIILNCSISDAEIEKWNAKRNPKEIATSPAEIRSISDHVLTLMTETMPQTVDVLWPYLLEPLTKPQYNGAMSIVAKSIAYISKIKRESGAANYMINFDKDLNLPKPQEIVARLFVLLHLPHRRGSLGLNFLNTLLYTGPVLHPSVAGLWDSTIPRMIQVLESLPESTDPAVERENHHKWAALVRRLLTETIKVVNDDKWIMEVGNYIQGQMELHGDDHVAKKVALKLLGTILQQIGHKEYIRETLQRMFDETDHSDEDERTGLAQGFGYAAHTHLDAVLDQQSNSMKPAEPNKKKEESSGGGGFFSIFGGDSNKKSEKPKSRGNKQGSLNSVLLSYGYIAVNAKPNILTSRLELQIISNMLPHLGTTDPLTRKTLIQSMDLIAQAVHPSKLQADFVFKQRDDFLRTILTYLNLRPPKINKDKKDAAPAPTAVPPPTLDTISIQDNQIEMAVLGLNAISTLLNLQPRITFDIEADLLNTSSQYYTVVKAEPSAKDKEREKQQQAKGESLNMDLIFENFDKVLSTSIETDPSMVILQSIIDVLSIFIRSKDVVHRTRAMGGYNKCLMKLVKIYSETKKVTDQDVSNLGPLVASLIPRAVDPSSVVRGYAIESIQLLFYIQFMLKQILQAQGQAVELSPPKTLAPFTGLRKRMVASEDVNEQYTLASSMATILSSALEASYYPTLIQHLVDGLVDTQPTSARGSCVILYGLVNARGIELKSHVIPIVTELINRMQFITNDATLNGSLHALKTIAKLHLDDVVEAILRQPIPHPPHVIKVLQLLARDADLILLMVKHLTGVLNNGDLLENDLTASTSSPNKQTPPNPQAPAVLMESKQKATPESLAATVSMAEILSEDEIVDVLKSHFALFFGTLLLRIGTTSNVDPPEASAQLVQCWKNFFGALEEDEVSEVLEEKGFYKKIAGDEFMLSVAAIVNVVCKHHSNERRNIFKFLLPFIKANYDGQRLVAVFACAEMVNNTQDDTLLLDQIITQLLSALVEPKLTIAALRGLGNITSCTQEQINTYSSSIVDALMASMDSQRDPVSLEAMNSLSKVIPLVEEARIAPFLINVCHRIRPSFDHDNELIRAASAALFGSLFRFGMEGAQSQAIIVEQIHEKLPCIIVHINDDSNDVKTAFRKALHKLVPVLGDENLKTIINTSHIFSVDYENDYNEFLYMHLSTALIKAFPDRLNGYIQTCIDPYFNSKWDIIKANASYFIGCVLFHLPKDLRTTTNINPGLIAKAMIQLLSTGSDLVKAKAAEALSMLHSY